MKALSRLRARSNRSMPTTSRPAAATPPSRPPKTSSPAAARAATGTSIAIASIAMTTDRRPSSSIASYSCSPSATSRSSRRPWRATSPSCSRGHDATRSSPFAIPAWDSMRPRPTASSSGSIAPTLPASGARAATASACPSHGHRAARWKDPRQKGRRRPGDRRDAAPRAIGCHPSDRGHPHDAGGPETRYRWKGVRRSRQPAVSKRRPQASLLVSSDPLADALGNRGYGLVAHGAARRARAL